ncbi:hypothetical protein GH714_043949 [Hevea brasiliensis]|uniref:Polysaccharide biosynthesis protein C-terminal domain-containing protein n=1 Tax=Hevea brasiliensis TaxID=3981 RepID=A0A6A6K1V7_HEVBR|nr:hypothetical protein GH714_043949 [Hevea brasiliensis]
MATDAVLSLWTNLAKLPLFVLFKDIRNVFRKDELGLEIAQIAVPAALALAADPVASLIDTAFIGHIGPVELAAVGVSIAVFNQVSKIAIFPLVSVTTSFVAEEDTTGRLSSELQENETIEDVFAVNKEMEELLPKAANIILDPIFIFIFRLDVRGAAIAHVISQYLISLILLWALIKHVDLLPPSIKDLQFSRFLKNGFMLLMRVIAATFCVTLAASLAARHGSTPMAAFQVCLQIWLATSLLADGLAVAGQAILASAFAKNDYNKAKATASRVLQDRNWNGTLELSQGLTSSSICSSP